MSEEGDAVSNEAENTAADGDQLPNSDVASTSPPPREKMIETAIKFLQNPQVRTSLLAQKKAFLQKKGLTAEEIEIAVNRSGTKVDIPSASATQSPPTAGAVPPYQNQPYGGGPHNQQMVPMQPPIVKSRYETWRDYTAMAVVVSGVSYGFYKLFERFLKPLLVSHQQEKERQERLEQSIQELSTSVRDAVGEMQKSMTSLNSLMEQQQAKFDQLSLEMSTSKSVIATGRSSDTAELKSEITSLKGLLLNRHQFPATPQAATIPEWQRAASVTQEATPTSTPSANQQTSPGPSPPITSSQDEVDRTLNGNALSNSSESDNQGDEPSTSSNGSVDTGDDKSAAIRQGKGDGDGSHDNQKESINQNGTEPLDENAASTEID